MWKQVSPRQKQILGQAFMPFTNFLIKPLKNGLILQEKLFFLKLNKNLGGPSTRPCDSKLMPSMLIYIDTWVVITSQGLNTKTTIPALEEWWKTRKLYIAYSTLHNWQGKKHLGIIGLMFWVLEIPTLYKFIMLAHFITTLPRGYEHAVQKYKKGLEGSMNFWMLIMNK